MKKDDVVIGYICKTDLIYHIPEDYDGVTVYFSEKSLRDHNNCVDECGIAKIEIRVRKD